MFEQLPPQVLVMEIWISGEFVPDVRILLAEVNGVVTAEVIQAAGDAVCEQVRQLYETNPSLTPEQASAAVSVVSRSHSAKKSPELAELFDRGKRLQFATTVSSSIFTPNRRVRMRVANRFEEIAVSFNQPEPLADGVAYAGDLTVSQPEVARWVERLLAILKVP